MDASFRSGTCFRWSLAYVVVFIVMYLVVGQLPQASVDGVVNIFAVNFDGHSLEQDNLTDDADRRVPLEDFSSDEPALIQSKLKIFFVQTSKNDDILARHACSIESAARLHSDGHIFVLMHSRYVHLQRGSYVHLRQYKNVHFRHFNEQQIYAGTSLTRLNQTTRKQYLRYFSISHMSDFLRTALLFKYGGIYFDLDVIPLKRFHSFVNTVALESTDSVNVAVLVLEKRHAVLDLQMRIQLESVEKQFNAFCWSCLGPLALTQALVQLCDQSQLLVHAKDKCHQIDIQPAFVFYPIPYQEIPHFFRRSSSADLDALLNNASIYSIHYFHHMTMNLQIEVQSPFARIAQIFCPSVYEPLLDQNPSKSSSSSSSSTRTNIVVFCLSLSLLVILVLLLAGRVLSSLRTMRITLLRRKRKL